MAGEFDALSLGLKIRDARLRKGWRQHNLANALGVSIQAVSQWERDATHPSIQRIIDIANVLGAGLEEFIREYSPEYDEDVRYPPPQAIPIISKNDVVGFAKNSGHPPFHKVTGSSTYGKGKIFGIEVCSDDMRPILMPGDIAIFDLGAQAADGDCVLAQSAHHNEAIVGIYKNIKLENGLKLTSISPLNESYPPRYFPNLENDVCATLFQLQRTFVRS